MPKRRLALALALMAAGVLLLNGLQAFAAGDDAGARPRVAAAQSPKALAPLLEDLAQINRELGKALDAARAGDTAGAKLVLNSYFGGGGGLNKDMLDGIKKLGPDFFAVYRLGLMNGFLVHVLGSTDEAIVVDFLERAKKQKELAETALREAGAPKGLLDDLAQINRELGKALDAARAGDTAGAKLVLNSYFGGGGGLNKDMLDGIKKLGPDFFAVYRLGLMNGFLVHVLGSTDEAIVVDFLERAKKQKELAETALLGQVGCTINGTPGPDVLKGTIGPNVLCGGGGNDKIDGKGGPDIIKGGAGNDVLLGGNGKDTLDGGKGSDSLDGGNGKDKLNGGPGADLLDGGKDKDVLHGGDGHDNCAAASGETRTGCEVPPARAVCTITFTYIGPATDNMGNRLTDPAASVGIQCDASIASIRATFTGRQIKRCQDQNGSPCEKTAEGGPNDTAVFATDVPKGQSYSFSINTDPEVQRGQTRVKLLIETDRDPVLSEGVM